MLDFFTDPYDDELLYSALARYHYYSGNVSSRQTLIQIFGDSNALPSVAVPSRLVYLANQLANSTYTPEYFISRHTILPYYLPFMDSRRQAEVIHAVKGTGGKGLYTMSGMAAGGICRKVGLYYCLQCMAEDINRYGEAYFHRIHQLEGIFICDRHGRILKEYPVTKCKASRIEFIRLNYKDIDLCKLGETGADQEDKSLITRLSEIARAARYVIDHGFPGTDNFRVYENITGWLASKGYLTKTGRVRQQDFCRDLLILYGAKLLDFLQCGFVPGKDYAWPCETVRRPVKSVHPLKYILVSIFLSGNAEGLFRHPKSVLNSQSDKATVKCPRYDSEWKEKLVEAIKSGGSLRGIAREMGCDPKTVVKHANALGVSHLLNFQLRFYVPKGNKKEAAYILAADDILLFMQNNPGCTRTDIRKCLCSQYMKLYRNRRELLYSILPDRVKPQPGGKRRVDWVLRDSEILEKVKMTYSRLLFLSKPVRISLSRLLKESGEPSLRFQLDKLPMTKQYIDKIVEGVEDYQLRRVLLVCRRLKDENGFFASWEVMRAAGLKSTASPKVLAEIERLCYEQLGEGNAKNQYYELAIPR